MIIRAVDSQSTLHRLAEAAVVVDEFSLNSRLDVVERFLSVDEEWKVIRQWVRDIKVELKSVFCHFGCVAVSEH